MSTLIYPGGCDSDSFQHTCVQCPIPEAGRISNMAFIHTSVAFTDQTNPAEWKAAMLLNLIKVIPNVNGTYDGGTATIGRGYGRIPKQKTGINFKLNIFDQNFRNNCAFYNSMMKTVNYRVAFCSESLMQISDYACFVSAKDPIEEPVESQRVWNLEIEFSQYSIACHTAIPGGIFLCETLV